MVSAIAACLETFLDTYIPNRFRISFGAKTSPISAEKYWEPILDAVLPFHAKLIPALEGGLANQDEANRAIADFRSMVEATRAPMAAIYKNLPKKLNF